MTSLPPLTKISSSPISTPHSPIPNPHSPLSFWLGLFLFSIYLLSFSGKFHVMDELAVFAAGNNLAQHGRADINQLIWTNHWTPTPPGVWGIDGNLYTKKAPGVSLAAAPFIWLGHTIPGLNAAHMSLLLSALVTALTGSFLLIWLLDLGFSRATATPAALSYGLLTIAWIYARMLWESAILALILLIVLWALYRALYTASRHSRRWILVSGLGMAVSLTMRFEMAVAVAFVGLFLLWEVGRRSPGITLLWSKLAALALYLIPVLLVGLGLLYFNYTRFGSIVETGYSRELLFERPWVGALGLLFSPGRGLFIYAPFMVLLFFGLRPAWRRLARPYFWLIAALCLFYWLFYGSWFAWGGTWGWGPRFLVPILPLLMLFVAEVLAISYALYSTSSWSRFRYLIWLGIGVLAGLSLLANFLGILVDFNEHFLRLGRNDDFVFNWAAIPLLGHWRILQEGLTDIIWLRLSAQGPLIDWSVLTPGLILFILATGGLIIAYQAAPQRLASGPSLFRLPLHPLALLLAFLLTLLLTYVMMGATARLALETDQAQADLPVLDRLGALAHPGDVLLVPMPPFGDVQEISTRLMAYLDRPLPTYIWIESEPRAIEPEGRQQIWQAVHKEAHRAWLFERWLTPADPLSPTAARFNRQAFPIWEKWFEQSGKLTLYGLANQNQAPAAAVPLKIPFQGGIELVNFTLLNGEVAPGEVLKIGLTWQIPAVDTLSGDTLPNESLISFVHLLAENAAGGNVVQQDRLLLDLQQIDRSPLLPGQTAQQGYGLLLPDDLSSGSYPLIAGLYLPTTGQRLPRTDNPDDFIYLTNVVVKKSN